MPAGRRWSLFPKHQKQKYSHEHLILPEEDDKLLRRQLSSHHGTKKARLLAAIYRTCQSMEETKELLKDLLAIVQSLEDTYLTSASVCPCFRYGELVLMIEETLGAYKKRLYGETPGQDGDKENLPLVCNIQTLREHCRRYSITTDFITKQNDTYSHMSYDDIAAEIKALQQQEDHMMKDVETEVKKLENLEKQYTESRQLCIFVRYGKLKNMIFDTIKSE